MMKLKELSLGDRALISGFAASSSAYRRKLLSMGLTLGTQFTVQRIAPLGDPIEIRLRGYALSLRKDEADALNLSRIAS
ncbi:FeoA family protein [Pseudorhodobacter wandonensis]|jgi:ferrous iron transport protein A|uniref:FeoA family protein n=1 Tax=Pseudorhodobacter wandonensis TaxID=1120568 RepID=UPI000B159F0A|nr:FeoA family protein [Pseudorhodobacter wandonensis]